MCVGLEKQLHEVLTSALVGGCQLHAPAALHWKKDTQVPIAGGWGGPWDGLNAVVRTKTSNPAGNQTPDIQTVA